MSSSKFFYNCKRVYCKYLKTLPIVVSFSGINGFCAGIHENATTNVNIKTIDRYINMVGYTGLGLVTGIFYPVSFSLCTYYSIYKTKNDKNN